MGDESFKFQCSSLRLQKAITKNQIIDNDLKKELFHIDLKKKSHEKAFQQKRTQFLRNRLCLNHLPQPGSSGKDGSRSVEKHVQKRPDLKSYSTGNLFESFLAEYSRSRSPSPSGSKIKNSDGMLNKLSFESTAGGVEIGIGKGWKRTVLSNERILEKSQSCEEKSSRTNLSKIHLHVPSRPSKFISKSEENLRTLFGGNENRSSFLRASKVKVRQTEHIRPVDNEKRNNRLLIPHLDKRLSRSDECFVTKIGRPRTTHFKKHEDIDTFQIKRQHSFCDNQASSYKTVPSTEATHLALPPLTRQRSKSMEAVIQNDEQPERSTLCSRTSTNANTKTSQNQELPRHSLTPSSARKLYPGPRKSTSFGETTEKEMKAFRDRSESKEWELQKSSSTPDLLGIGPKEQHLPVNNNKTRLKGMCLPLLALNRHEEFQQAVDHPPKVATGPDQLPANIDIANSNSTEHIEDTEIDCAFNDEEDDSVFMVGASTEDSNEEISETNNCESGNDAVKKLNDPLNSSNSSTLAEMFEEIKKTRYLRIPSTSEDLELEDAYEETTVDICNQSYSHNTPLIIVGHTKTVLMELMKGDNLDVETDTP